MKNSKKIKALREYFIAEPSVLIAFLFGSRSKSHSRETSDWDIAVYFKPKNRRIELEENIYYPEEERISFFLKEAKPYFERFLEKLKEFLE